MEKKIITISREFGSGGRTNAKTLAERLGLAYYDKELVKQVAIETGLDQQYVEDQGEFAPSKGIFAYSFLEDVGMLKRVIIRHTVEKLNNYLAGSLMLLSFIIKAFCSYISTWKAHDAAYSSLTDLRLQLIRSLKKLPLGFFQERKIGDLTNIIQHDVEQVEIYLAHGLPEIMAATLLPAIILIIICM